MKPQNFLHFEKAFEYEYYVSDIGNNNRLYGGIVDKQNLYEYIIPSHSHFLEL